MREVVSLFEVAFPCTLGDALNGQELGSNHTECTYTTGTKCCRMSSNPEFPRA